MIAADLVRFAAYLQHHGARNGGVMRCGQADFDELVLEQGILMCAVMQVDIAALGSIFVLPAPFERGAFAYCPLPYPMPERAYDRADFDQVPLGFLFLSDYADKAPPADCVHVERPFTAEA